MTAYELRISDWSSDVCSSDLLPLLAWGYPRAVDRWYALLDRIEAEALPVANPVPVLRWNSDKAYHTELGARDVAVVPTIEVRSEERRVGKECVSTCRSRGRRYN